MSKKRRDEETDDTVEKLKRIYKEIVGYDVSNHIGTRELEEAAFSEIGLTDDQVDEFIEHINEEFDVDLTADDMVNASPFGDFINQIEAAVA